MTGLIRTCTVMPLPEDRFVEAARRAIKENPKNAPIRRLPAELAPGGGGPAELAVVTAKRWNPGRTLKAKFMGGLPRVRERLVPFAKEWEKHANVKLDFVGDSAEAEVRIAFTNSGSWSYLGTDALVIDADRPTMNYGWLTPEGPDDEYSRVVLHEFGHALSCIHEHNHPEAGIPWDRESVYEYYATTQGWSREDVDQQVLNRYTASETNFSHYDRDSIMHYPVDNALTVGNFQVGWNRVLSQMDKDFIGLMYPKAAPEEIELRAAEPADGEIGTHGEEDTYILQNSRTGELATISTHGPTDVVMGLYGPNDPTRLVAVDDDSGKDFNAKIRASLDAGKYWVRVRHWHPTGTGRYQVELLLGA